MNKVLLMGNLTKDPELKFSKDKGIPYTKGTLAVNDRIKNTTYFIPFVMFNKIAEALSQYGKKGSSIGISGKLEHTTYTKEDNSRGYCTTVLAESFEFVSFNRKSDVNEDALLKKEDDFELVSNDNLPF